MTLLHNFLLSLTMKEFRKSTNIWWSYGQELGVLFFWLTVYNSPHSRSNTHLLSPIEPCVSCTLKTGFLSFALSLVAEKETLSSSYFQLRPIIIVLYITSDFLLHLYLQNLPRNRPDEASWSTSTFTLTESHHSNIHTQTHRRPTALPGPQSGR